MRAWLLLIFIVLKICLCQLTEQQIIFHYEYLNRDLRKEIEHKKEYLARFQNSVIKAPKVLGATSKNLGDGSSVDMKKSTNNDKNENLTTFESEGSNDWLAQLERNTFGEIEWKEGQQQYLSQIAEQIVKKRLEKEIRTLEKQFEQSRLSYVQEMRSLFSDD